MHVYVFSGSVFKFIAKEVFDLFFFPNPVSQVSAQ